jgi:D-glycero-D-manno-heptose 1,7-bisphosphate phosphatase
MNSEAARAAFLDRDGVINLDTHHTFRIEDFQFLPGVFEACRQLQASHYRLIVVTNQAGIAKGKYTEADFHYLNDWMTQQFAAQGVEIDAVYYCPHHPVDGLGLYLQSCTCRKPAPGMILRAARERQLNLAASVLFGDKMSDIEAGWAAGIGRCFLLHAANMPIEAAALKVQQVESLWHGAQLLFKDA